MMCLTAFPVIRKSEVGDARSGRDREDLAARYRDGRSIRGISRDLGVSRVTNQKVLRSETTEFRLQAQDAAASEDRYLAI